MKCPSKVRVKTNFRGAYQTLIRLLLFFKEIEDATHKVRNRIITMIG